MPPLEDDLLAEARRLGFVLAGIAPATPADDFARYEAWLDDGHAGEMGYLEKHAKARRHPAGVFPQVRSVLMVGMSYAPDRGAPPSKTGRVALYAQGADYHAVLRERLKGLGRWLAERRPGCRGRVAVDTAPLLERGFARRAGLGWVGKNTLLIHPRHGSWIVLGALLLDIELVASEPFDTFHCGTCRRCLDACPTQAFVGAGNLDARKCISYHTIERKGPLEEPWRIAIDDWLYGCDICQEVCPWNRKAPTGHDALAARADLVTLDARELLGLDAAQFREKFTGTAMYPRPGRPVLLRNAALVLGNTGGADALPALRRATSDPEPVVREAALWAIGRIESRLGTGGVS
jgi:epoxyqueuosine reductase